MSTKNNKKQNCKRSPPTSALAVLPWREAFRAFENEYLVLGTPRKGCHATQVSMEDCQHIYEARKTIKCYAIKLLKAQNVRDSKEPE